MSLSFREYNLCTTNPTENCLLCVFLPFCLLTLVTRFKARHWKGARVLLWLLVSFASGVASQSKTEKMDMVHPMPIWSKSRTLQMARKSYLTPPTSYTTTTIFSPQEGGTECQLQKTQRALKSFIPSTIKYLNQPHKINHWPTSQSIPLPLQDCFIIFIYLSYDIVIIIINNNNNFNCKAPYTRGKFRSEAHKIVNSKVRH